MIEPDTYPEHDAFDALCSEVEDYDSLPTVVPTSPAEYLVEHPEEELDNQILAGLISP